MPAAATDSQPRPLELTISKLSIDIASGELTLGEAAGDFNSAIEARHLLFSLRQNGDKMSFTTAALKEAVAPDDSEPFKLVLIHSDAISDELSDAYLIDKFPPYLVHDAWNQVDVVMSTKSGTHLALPFWSTVLQPLLSTLARTFPEAKVDQANILVTESAESVSDFARQLWSSPAAPTRTVILLSGDGGMVDILNGRQEGSQQRPTIALLPMGTGNALFHSNHKPLCTPSGPSPLVLGVRTLFVEGVAAALPIFRASFTPGAHIVHGDERQRQVSHLDGAIVASYGFHASVVYESDTPAHRVHGDKRFGMVAQELLREAHAYSAHVAIQRMGTGTSSNREVLDREKHGYLLTTLLSNLEKTFTISPASKPLDGQLRTVHFGDIGGERALDAMMKAYDGGKHVDVKWDDGERIYYQDIDEIRITVKETDQRWRKVCIDGTIVDVPTGGTMTVKKLHESPLRILVNKGVR
ncbi:uncharacterized protein J7T54_006949 [Emericellopsis cladophorae]|uniref:DAGKc domain-containing protein n=1 Tax=Emericellopsis cladophorae TaxID=2686198 RepID=A0A9P9Y862_9HYPO|nr:uncharacterized protein J7T54_006949 [Emericellopsis cladophorae]KAI6785307.1 hypothetical protein J7T54_006949 [Emericellopsis cladophorae]